MTAREKSNRRRTNLVAWPVVVFILLLPRFGQAQYGDSTFCTCKMKHRSARVAAQTVQELVGPETRVIIDSQTNRLILEGSKEAIERARKIVQELDQPQDPRPFNVSSIRPARLEEIVARLRQEFAPDEVRVTHDPLTGQVIVIASSPSGETTARVVWSVPTVPVGFQVPKARYPHASVNPETQLFSQVLPGYPAVEQQAPTNPMDFRPALSYVGGALTLPQDVPCLPAETATVVTPEFEAMPTVPQWYESQREPRAAQPPEQTAEGHVVADLLPPATNDS